MFFKLNVLIQNYIIWVSVLQLSHNKRLYPFLLLYRTGVFQGHMKRYSVI